MDGRLVPSGLFAIEPAWRNLFENAMTVQFAHRMIAYAVALYAAFLAWRRRSSSAFALLAVVIFQITLGIWTLLEHAPLAQGLAHQAGAMILFATSVWNLHEQRSARSQANQPRFAL